MSSTLSEDRLLVDDVVNALTNPPNGEEGVISSLGEQMQRAAEDFDRRTAQAFARALVDSLCEDPADVRRLEALLILGLAHPTILDKYQVSLAAEGRRLCVLLEGQGDADRARSLLEVLATRLPDERELQQDLSSFMRRAGDVDQLVERCLRRADEEVRKGRPMEAISWLQEVLLHDQSRRDVARMIRDLRYQEMEALARAKRRSRLILLVVVIASTLSALGMREHKINQEYAALPPLSKDSISVNARLQGIDELIASNHLWFGMFQVVSERSDLQEEMDRIGAKQASEQRKEKELKFQLEARAESLRLSAIDKVGSGNLEGALADFKGALEASVPDWERRERIEANILAIQRLLDQRN